VLTVSVELVMEAKVVEPDEPIRLDFDKDLRKVGVSKDSRAFGSSSLVYLPIEGLWITWCFPIVFPISSVKMLKIFLLLSVVIVD